MRQRYRILVLLLVVILGTILGYQQLLPPAPPSDLEESPILLEAAKAEPDLQMMLSHLQIIAKEPRPVGSDAIRGAQTYLKTQIDEMGFTWQEETHTVTIEEMREVQERLLGVARTQEEVRAYAGIEDEDQTSIDLTNIYAVVDAPETDETVIIMAHTDSVVYGPGAFDDGVAVASMLEGMRSLQDRTPVRDMVFLFTDGEEQGLIGAEKFVAAHPEWKEKTIAVINLEARGNAGALIFFESSPKNLNLSHMYRNAVPNPIATSIATTVYDIMPNDTDLSAFLEAGYPGMNFAVIDGGDVYHTEKDHYANFDRASAYHYLTTTTGLVEAMALTPDLVLDSPYEAIQFPFLRGNLVVFPEPFGVMLGVLAFVLALGRLAWLRRTGKITVKSTLIAPLWQLLCMLIAGLIGYFGVRLILGENADLWLTYSLAPWFYLVLLLLAGLCMLFTSALLLRLGMNRLSFAVGNLILFGLLALATAVTYPGVSYLFSLPILLAVLPLLMYSQWGKPTWFFFPVGVFISLLLWVPVGVLLYQVFLLYGAHITLAIATLPMTMLTAQSLYWAGPRMVK